MEKQVFDWRKLRGSSDSSFVLHVFFYFFQFFYNFSLYSYHLFQSFIQFYLLFITLVFIQTLNFTNIAFYKSDCLTSSLLLEVYYESLRLGEKFTINENSQNLSLIIKSAQNYYLMDKYYWLMYTFCKIRILLAWSEVFVTPPYEDCRAFSRRCSRP